MKVFDEIHKISLDFNQNITEIREENQKFLFCCKKSSSPSNLTFIC
jgi:hypothetical protein